ERRSGWHRLRGKRRRQLAVRLARHGAQLRGTGQLGQESETRRLRVRAFFGLPIPAGHRERLGSYIQAQGVLASKFSWTPAENLHVTIRFLGHLELEVADRIAGRVDASA